MSVAVAGDAPPNQSHARLAGLPNEQHQKRLKNELSHVEGSHQVDNEGYMTHNRRGKKLCEDFRRGTCEAVRPGRLFQGCGPDAPVFQMLATRAWP